MNEGASVRRLTLTAALRRSCIADRSIAFRFPLVRRNVHRMRPSLGVALLLPAQLLGQAAAQRPRPRPHPLPVVGATRGRFAAVDAVTLGERIFVVERTATGGWLRAYEASDVANPWEMRDARAPVPGRGHVTEQYLWAYDRNGRYVLQPRPPKPKPRKPAAKRAPRKSRR